MVLTFDRPLAGAWSCDLMEACEEELRVHGNAVTVPVKPFEVITLRIAMAGGQKAAGASSLGTTMDDR